MGLKIYAMNYAINSPDLIFATYYKITESILGDV